MNICLVFSYNGIKFFGYQKQPNKRTVQEEIESCLSQIFNENINTAIFPISKITGLLV